MSTLSQKLERHEACWTLEMVREFKLHLPFDQNKQKVYNQWWVLIIFHFTNRYGV